MVLIEQPQLEEFFEGNAETLLAEAQGLNRPPARSVTSRIALKTEPLFARSAKG